MLDETKKTEAIAALDNLVSILKEKLPKPELVDLIRINAQRKIIADVLVLATKEQAAVPAIPGTVTTQEQPESVYEDIAPNIAVEKLSRKEQTSLITQGLEYIAKGRSIISRFIRHDDATVISINSPTGYNQPIVNTMNMETENLKMVVSTATNAYFVTYSARTKFMSVGSSKYFKTPAAIAKEKAK